MELNFAQFSQVRVNAQTEWRNAWRITQEGTYEMELGLAQESGWLHLGLLDAGQAGAGVQISVFAGSRRIHNASTAGDGVWHDWRLPVSQENAGLPLKVTFSASHPFWVSDCALLAPQDEAAPNVLLYLVDTLRASHLGAYGYERAATPHIDALAQDAVLFTRAVPQSSWTRPSVASLLTSTYPATHGGNDRSQVINANLDTLGAALAGAGYETQAFMSNPSCTPYWGIGKEFNRFVDVDSVQVEPDKDERVVDAALDAMELLEGRPWFLYVHTIAPHNPYEAPAPFGGMFSSETYAGTPEEQERQRVIDAYDEEIAYTDAQFGRVIEYLKSTGQYENTLIVFLSDHGEEFLEHGSWGHGHSLYQEQLDIPLIVKLPGQSQAGTLREDLVELVDIAPTMLEVLGVARPAKFQGNAVLPENQRTSPFAYASLQLEKRSMRTALDATSKIIEDFVDNTHLAFDLADDPAELNPLDAAHANFQALRQHARSTSAMGVPGLHILITGSLQDGSTLSGSVRGGGLEDATLNYSAQNFTLNAQPELTRFEVTLAPGSGAPTGLANWSGVHATQNYAHLLIPCAPQELSLSLELDGAPLPPEMLYATPKDKMPLITGTPVDSARLNTPVHIDPATLPQRSAVYVWYSAPGVEISDDRLHPDMREALEALGYIE